jgi:hypothetical protein
MIHLICIQPFHGYAKGQRVSDPDEVAKLQLDREHHFIRIPAPEKQETVVLAETEAEA